MLIKSMLPVRFDSVGGRTMEHTLLIFALLLIGSHVTFGRVPADQHHKDGCKLDRKLIQEIHGYRPVVNRIYEEIVNGRFAGKVWDDLEDLSLTFGARLSGSPQLEKAIDYVMEEMKRDGLENVHAEDAPVPHWVRGEESATLVEPFPKKLPMLALGESVGTPEGGITAEVVVVRSFDELDAMDSSEVEGKILVFAPEWVSYGATVQYRGRGPTEAAKKGAIACLIRSMGPMSIGSPHTGGVNYEEGVKKIPAACITVEDAEMLLRLKQRNSKITVHLEMGCQNFGLITSRNTIGELQGTVHKNNSVIVLTGHLDSWDVGLGAMDDGGGVMISWKALTFLKAMGLRPRRTMRAVLFTAEEQGYWGERQYFEDHREHAEEEFDFILESDAGTFDPKGYQFSGNEEAACIFTEVAKLVEPYNMNYLTTSLPAGSGIRFSNKGFPYASFITENDKYFWFHHSEGDSMMVVDPKSLDKCTAVYAATAYVLADLSVSLPKTVNLN
ncbi:carboxypeptidase Q-like [Uranotaenia lowii]|uniref:carboxypeptidase Q-like n=1 Tax=Uranotaenia lowii TaxID=190385 RepID=UPI002478FC85|nr:carboxypeptidase Q-like [Uranotaenia lowii]